MADGTSPDSLMPHLSGFPAASLGHNYQGLVLAQQGHQIALHLPHGQAGHGWLGSPLLALVCAG